MRHVSISKQLALAAGLSVWLSALPGAAQTAPPSPDRPWTAAVDARLLGALSVLRESENPLDARKSYGLAELVDIAERRNPETRVAWERAMQRAASLGVARAALFPTVAALASASINRYSLFVDKFYREETGVFPIALNASYTLLDFGARSAQIDVARANLLASDFVFNDAHRRIVYQVTEAYYRLLEAIAQEGAAEATLTDAQTVQESVEAKLQSGLATRPDVLEARAATADARYELTSVQGLEATARGAVAAALGLRPTVTIRVDDLSRVVVPTSSDEPIDALIDRALGQRPDLLASVVRVQAAEAQTSLARSSLFPSLAVSGEWGHSNAYGQQNLGPIVHGSIFPYQVQLKLNWTLFDGGARREELVRSQAAHREAEAELTSLRDRIENELWVSYTDLTTARRRAEAAEALLEAATETYDAVQQAYQSGVRTFIDVTTAQRDLARARTAQVTARAQLLTSLASLAFRTGDPLRAPAPRNTP